MQLSVFGVGRSGTTALYVGLQNLILANKLNYRYIYEPYLWSHRVFDKPFAEVKDQFRTTASLSIEGIYAHKNTPLFTDADNPIHDRFLSLITQDTENFLIKVIRGNGRLSLFLEKFPELRVVYILRNPLDTISSVINQFSFFGDEFHPSDKPRFLQEIEQILPFSVDSTIERDEVEWSLLWWQFMNRAALKAIDKYRDRVFIVAYEAFKADPIYALHEIGQFLKLDTRPLASQTPQRPVGPITTQVYLEADHVNLIKSQDDEYWQNLIWYSDIPLKKNIQEEREAIYDRYLHHTNAKSMAQSLVVPTDWSSLLVRKHFLGCKQANQKSSLNLKDKNLLPQPEDPPNSNGIDQKAEWEHDRFAWIRTQKPDISSQG